MAIDELPTPLPEMMEIAGIPCHVDETTALEAWFMMNGLRRVICADAPPAMRGSLVHIVTKPLEPKEIAFIREQMEQGNFPPLSEFQRITGIVGVTDFHVEPSTDLPGWDGESIPVILENPRWYMDGELVPVPPPMVFSEPRKGKPRHPPGHRRGRNRRR